MHTMWRNTRRGCNYLLSLSCGVTWIIKKCDRCVPRERCILQNCKVIPLSAGSWLFHEPRVWTRPRNSPAIVTPSCKMQLLSLINLRQSRERERVVRARSETGYYLRLYQMSAHLAAQSCPDLWSNNWWTSGTPLSGTRESASDPREHPPTDFEPKSSAELKQPMHNSDCKLSSYTIFLSG